LSFLNSRSAAQNHDFTRVANKRLAYNMIGVDLSCGVTDEEAKQGKVLELCLDEIERCRPFFVCLLRERFG